MVLYLNMVLTADKVAYTATLQEFVCFFKIQVTCTEIRDLGVIVTLPNISFVPRNRVCFLTIWNISTVA